ncbi:MAG TPA: YtxH domain-containing protein [Bryobacteraceae bacterium]|nr:YtxH domain-containing protein [Bryobacteraceae bacterium]
MNRYETGTSCENTGALPMLLLGAGLGVCMGMLFAPRPGQALRSTLRSKAEDGRDYLVRQRDLVTEKAHGLMDQGKETVMRQKSALKAAVEAGIETYQRELQAANRQLPSEMSANAY